MVKLAHASFVHQICSKKMLQLNHLCKNHSALSDIMLKIRDVEFQKDKARFRELLELSGSLMAYELSKKLPYHTKSIQTPLAKTSGSTFAQSPVIASILRAGIPLQQGAARVFREADLAFISAYRYYEKEQLKVHVEYVATPPLDGRILILCDPMLATGHSLHLVWQQLETYGTPSELHLMSVLGSRQGVSFAEKHFSEATLWIMDIDPILDDHNYIYPGLGDAGDLCFGEKLSGHP
jgi:uracil phosphoribosyltransferase